MNILLIEPRGADKSEGMSRLTNVDINEPLGICYLAAVAKSAGFKTKIVQQFDDVSNSKILEQTKCFTPDVVGISTMTFNYNNGRRLAQEIKAIMPSTVIVFGGIHATLNPEIVLDPAIDFAVLGEGEKTFIDLLTHIDRGRANFQEIHGIAYDKSGEVFVTTPRPRMTSDELTSLPFPDREDLPMERYKRFSLSYPPPSLQKHASINFGRGCTYHCTFCTSPKEWQNGRIERNPKNVVDEMEYLINKFGTNFLFFRDEDFLLDTEKVTELCEEVLRRAVKISWYCHGRVSDINGHEIAQKRTLLELMKKAGCFEIVYGIETGDEETLSRINKRTTLRQAETAVRITSESGIMTGCLFMIGFPWETKASLFNTLNFAKDLEYDRIRVTFATPFKGTIFYEQSKDDLLTEDLDDFDTNEIVIRSRVSPDYLELFQKKMYKRLYMSKTYLLRCMLRISREPRLLGSYLQWFKFLYNNLCHHKSRFVYHEEVL